MRARRPHHDDEALTEEPINFVIVIPTLNEEVYIGNCIKSLLSQIGSGGKIIVADGGSSDATRFLVTELSRQDDRVQLIDNPRILQAAAVNLVARKFCEANFIIRADAHALYPPNFIEALLRGYRGSGAKAVVIPMYTIGTTCFQKAVAAAQNSKLGNGGAPHRNASRSAFVDHGHHALFELPAFLSIGGYDEGFSHNEDVDFDHRLAMAGGKILLCSEAVVNYFPRSSPFALAKQYFRHGQGRARTLFRHKYRPRLRQLLPVAILAICVSGAIGSLHSPAALLGPLAYFLLCLFWGGLLALRSKDRCILASGPAAVIMHLSWASGLVTALIRYNVTAQALWIPTGKA